MRTNAHMIVKAILNNLDDRRGVGDELGQVRCCDPEVWEELVETLEEIVQKELDK